MAEYFIYDDFASALSTYIGTRLDRDNVCLVSLIFYNMTVKSKILIQNLRIRFGIKRTLQLARNFVASV